MNNTPPIFECRCEPPGVALRPAGIAVHMVEVPASMGVPNLVLMHLHLRELPDEAAPKFTVAFSPAVAEWVADELFFTARRVASLGGE